MAANPYLDDSYSDDPELSFPGQIVPEGPAGADSGPGWPIGGSGGSSPGVVSVPGAMALGELADELGFDAGSGASANAAAPVSGSAPAGVPVEVADEWPELSAGPVADPWGSPAISPDSNQVGSVSGPVPGDASVSNGMSHQSSPAGVVHSGGSAAASPAPGSAAVDLGRGGAIHFGGLVLSASEGNAAALEALALRIMDDECSEVICNGPSEVLVKINGQRYVDQHATFTSVEAYHAALNQILRFSDTRDQIDGRTVLVEGQLEIPAGNPGEPPMLGRIHILAPPLVPHAKVTIAKKARWSLTIDGMVQNGSLTPGMASFLKAVTKARLTFVVAGPTGSGKTTLLQAMCHHFDLSERIIVVEDTPELRLLNGDTVHLVAKHGQPGRDEDLAINMEWLVRAANRMRMDRIVVGEVRGGEMADWLIAANSGAEGSAVTLHADSPRRALDKMLFLATKAEGAPGENTLRREIASTVDVIVQTGLIDGRHVVTGIEEVSSSFRDNHIIATTELIDFDRSLGLHIVRNPPSDELISRIRMAGIPIDPSWFPAGR